MHPWSLLALLSFASPMVAAPLTAQACSATPEAAAKSALGGSVAYVAGGAGFRLQDLQLDPVLRRAWARVRRCDDAAAPALLVPVPAPSQQTASMSVAGLHLATTTTLTVVASPPIALNTSPPKTPPVMLLHSGDTVRVVFDSSAVHMALEATANQQGGVGDTIQLTLKHRTAQAVDEPEHRIHGIVRADKTVEVQP